jgi:hypothetical protein
VCSLAQPGVPLIHIICVFSRVILINEFERNKFFLKNKIYFISLTRSDVDRGGLIKIMMCIKNKKYNILKFMMVLFEFVLYNC